MYSFEKQQQQQHMFARIQLKEYLKDPSKFAAAAPAANAPAATGGKSAPAKEESKKAAEPESDDDDMGGLDIFG